MTLRPLALDERAESLGHLGRCEQIVGRTPPSIGLGSFEVHLISFVRARRSAREVARTKERLVGAKERIAGQRRHVSAHVGAHVGTACRVAGAARQEPRRVAGAGI